MILARIICLLVACYDLCFAQTDANVNVDHNNDMLIYDFVYGCLVEYSEKLFTALNQDFTTKEQIYEECNLYTEFQGCLSQKSGETYIQMFIAGLGRSMQFCQCLKDLYEFLNYPGVNKATTSNIVCGLYEEQANCLQTHFYSNPFVKELMTDLDAKLDSEYCEPTITEEPTPITPTNQWTTPGTTPKAPGTKPEGPGDMGSNCNDVPHPNSKTCALWLHENYHSVHTGWKPCSRFSSGGYGRPCGYWWAKCKKLVKNQHCCISAHCFGVRG